MPSVTFTTKADEPPTYDTRQLVFGMPDANGFVSFNGLAGTLPPGTQVLAPVLTCELVHPGLAAERERRGSVASTTGHSSENRGRW